MNNTIRFWVLQINKIKNYKGLLKFAMLQMEAIKFEQISSEDAESVSVLLSKYIKDNNIE